MGLHRSRKTWASMDRRLGGDSASQHPPGTGKSFRFGRACVRAVSVMSAREENAQWGLYLLSFLAGGRIFYPLEIFYL